MKGSEKGMAHAAQQNDQCQQLSPEMGVIRTEIHFYTVLICAQSKEKE
jgi:hypothetical protein